MKTKSTSHFTPARRVVPRLRDEGGFFNLRVFIALLLCAAAACSVFTGVSLAFFRPKAPPKVSRRAVTFADRVAYQRAIEEVYWRHRLWPKERPDPKPSLDAVISQAQIEKKVEHYLRDSQVLEDYWQQPITAEQLQAEMERMAQHTKQPEVLRELFDTLRNDPFVVAECLARPALTERLVLSFYAHDQRFHGELRQRAEADLRTHNTVEQMKQLGGEYSETELVRSDSSPEKDNRGAEASVRLNSREWDESVRKLATTFNKPGADRAFALAARRNDTAFESADMSAHSKDAATETYETLPTGKLSSLQEDDIRYYATAVIKKREDRLRLATVEWRKEPVESWRAKAKTQMREVASTTTANYALPKISDEVSVCIDDTWTAARTTNAPSARDFHTAVWTGSEMIVWGGRDAVSYFDTGGRYTPGTDSWTTTSTINAPDGRYAHTAVWTGTEMIVWGGFSFVLGSLNTGGRYDPGTDSWTATSTINAPDGRLVHTAVWTGSEMIVWGGSDNISSFDTGGRYTPGTDSWTATSTANAPDGRFAHTAVWTGTEMIVWGGSNISGDYFHTGGRYNPGLDSWAATSANNTPSARGYHTAVWTGSEMIVWGGADGNNFLDTGGRYNPGTDSWTATSTANAPSAREVHTAVWTGSEMIVWGGFNNSDLNTGRRYNPGTDSWTATSTTNAPDGRFAHTAVWTGSEMIVWGGFNNVSYFNTGGRYCVQSPCANYVTTPGTDTIVPGTTDIGNHTDDGDTFVALPFSFQLYNRTHNSVNVSSNGRLDLLIANDPGGFQTACLPAPPGPAGPYDFTIFPLWNDLRTDVGLPGCQTWASGCGIFTSVSGSTPNRIFNIEWRAVLFADVSATQNFEVRLYENPALNQRFDVIIGALNSASTAHPWVSGVQGPDPFFTQDFCIDPPSSPPQNVSRTYTMAPCATPTPTPTSTPTPASTPTPTATPRPHPTPRLRPTPRPRPTPLPRP